MDGCEKSVEGCDNVCENFVLIFCSCFVVGLHDGACDEWRADRCRLQNSSFKELRVVVMEFILLIAQLTVLLYLQ